MRQIDITTTQKVTIKYELASLQDRIFAYFLDAVIVLTSTTILRLIVMGAFGYNEVAALFEYLVFYPILIFYTLLMEYFNNGQTIGKSILGIKVVKLNGKAPNFSDYLTRWGFRAIDIYLSLGSIAMLLISSSAKGQRLGDITSNTTLIKVRFNLRFRLEDIVQISSLDDYEPLYPQVRELSEEDMLLIKNVIMRSQKFDNQAHRDAIYDLVKRLKERLDIQELVKDNVAFLKTLIKDYIVLTR